MKILARDNYLALLRKDKDRQSLKLITGVRGSGKTVVLAQFAKEVKKNGGHVVYLDLNDKKTPYTDKLSTLLSYCYASYNKDKRNYLFIEGVEQFHDFDELSGALYRQRRFDVYLSSSFRLTPKSPIRYVEIEVRPLNYHEFLKLNGLRNEQKSLERFILYGGFPILSDPKIFARKAQYGKKTLKTVMDEASILYSIKKEDYFTPFSLYLTSKEGEETSSHKLAQAVSLKTNKKFNHHTVNSYLSILQNANLVSKVSRYDCRKKSEMKTLEKYVLSDPLFKSINYPSSNPLSQRNIENLIIRELLNKGLEVYTAQVYNDYAGILAKKGKWKCLIRYEGEGEEKKLDEAARLLLYSHEEGEKIILLNARKNLPSREGVKIMSLYDWLLIDRSRG